LRMNIVGQTRGRYSAVRHIEVVAIRSSTRLPLGRLNPMAFDDDDWVGEPPEGRHTRDQAKPEYWRQPWPWAGAGTALLIVIVVLLLVLR